MNENNKAMRERFGLILHDEAINSGLVGQASRKTLFAVDVVALFH
ncbi:hypothetical protein [Pseudomonas sp. Y24-6]|nr:hypothetical protein [Pseudomonas sp. Y24-6]